MSVPLDPVLLDDQHKIIEWTKAWWEQARATDIIGFPAQVDNDMIKRLKHYYRAGFTPKEALHACFGLNQ